MECVSSYTITTPKARKEVDEMEQSIRYLVQHMPGHGDYLARYCPARAA